MSKSALPVTMKLVSELPTPSAMAWMELTALPWLTMLSVS